MQDESPMRLFAEGWILCFHGLWAALQLTVGCGSRMARGRASSSNKLLANAIVIVVLLILLALYLFTRGSSESISSGPMLYSVDGSNSLERNVGIGRSIHRSQLDTVGVERHRQWEGDVADRMAAQLQQQDTGGGGPFVNGGSFHGRMPAAVGGAMKMSKNSGTGGCPMRRPEEDGSSLALLGRRLSVSVVHNELLEKLDLHTALQHMMCRKQAGFQAVRALVFACQLRNCFNFTTGLRGVLLAYLLAVMTNRAFFIRAETWMNFHSHLQVSPSWRAIDWQIDGCTWARMKDEKKLHSTLWNSRILSYVTQRDPSCDRILNYFKMPPNILGIMTDQDVNCGYKVLAKGNLEVSRVVHRSPYSMAFSRLFSFSDEVLHSEYRLQKEYDWQPEKSICLHVRTGAFPNQDTAGNGHRNVADFWQCARALEQAVGLDTQNGVSWLVISDSDQTHHSAEKYLDGECRGPGQRVVLSPSLVVNDAATPQHDRNANADGAKRMFLDMRLLSQCQYTVLSKSAFGTMAASIISDQQHLSSKHHVLVTEQEIAHDKPLSQLCRRVIPDWDSFQYP